MDGEIGQVVSQGDEDNYWIIRRQVDGEEYSITFGHRITWNNPITPIDELLPGNTVLVHPDIEYASTYTGKIVLASRWDGSVTVINRMDVCTRCEKKFGRDNTTYSHYSCQGTSVAEPRSIRNPSVENFSTIPCNNSSPTICSDCKRCESCAKLQKEREEQSQNFVQDDDALDRAMYD